MLEEEEADCEHEICCMSIGFQSFLERTNVKHKTFSDQRAEENEYKAIKHISSILIQGD